MKTYKCRSCGEKIIFIQTPSGSSMPCNAEPVYYKATPGAKGRVVTPTGDVVAAIIDVPPEVADGIGYISHFASCTSAASFRRK